ncbi:MAG: EF-hand domain-containing protein [Pirellulaceae bacterium]|jgi:hypothetical protein|nr:EF-hand domain-containing protein [Pirellulaceae bacterium]MDP7020502.1 EF-hand domain-containing protein [Pirellulaceae bacterium]
MKRLTHLLTLLSVVFVACECTAQAQVRDRANRAANANGQRRLADGQRPQGGRPDRDPAQIVVRMLKEFDKDGDNKLNAKELTALFVALRERRGGAARQGAGANDKGQRRQRNGVEPDAPGGQVPQRPPSE